MQELRPGLWHWQAPHPEWRSSEPWDQNVSSYAIDDEERLLLIDPLIGRIGHRRQRSDLQAEIAHQQTALRLARTQLTKLPLKQTERQPTPPPRTHLEPESRAITRTRARERDLGRSRAVNAGGAAVTIEMLSARQRQRKPESRSLARERERDLGLEVFRYAGPLAALRSWLIEAGRSSFVATQPESR